MASTSFANTTIVWQIKYNTPVDESTVTLPAAITNISFWSDSSAALYRTNDTHRYDVEEFCDETIVQQSGISLIGPL